eukprot:CAMPEP_0182855772 /NCGR_PEP_ID=MMETSP0034_2-20130328/2045_1 /TAXON_ID=156128 /ORGANISM="Nephroselmis pyriformis, Strain CCMP717" /LENGTH=116 /DNA_ID=CAMNT_0024986781 /DNA_START=41 /DNA_END=391 /DNA_ORIENTATION=-
MSLTASKSTDLSPAALSARSSAAALRSAPKIYSRSTVCDGRFIRPLQRRRPPQRPQVLHHRARPPVAHEVCMRQERDLPEGSPAHALALLRGPEQLHAPRPRRRPASESLGVQGVE